MTTHNNEINPDKHPDYKKRGELIELAFIFKAASLGFSVARPYGDSNRYDLIVDSGKRLLRIQVKSTIRVYRGGYSVHATGSPKREFPAYTAEEIDFLVAYIIPLDIWYIVPVVAFTPEQVSSFTLAGAEKTRDSLNDFVKLGIYCNTRMRHTTDRYPSRFYQATT